MRPSVRMIGALLGTTALTCAMTTAAHAGTAPIGSFQFSIVYHSGKPAKSVTLTCLPTGGSHPDRMAACMNLMLVNGEVASIPPSASACFHYYDPVTASASGTWNGRPVTYSARFTNESCARIATGGHVFNF
jgi:hypothetical protein